ncbi:hypothetical protein [Arthrobacter sp. NPDC089319]|uniref:hypothetical protein n=1 Tax=Arthrobacter sp. NPDC089319 TaxID=3155915 RepID=UPI00342A7FE0
MTPETRQLHSTTGLLVRPVEDVEDFAGNPGKYMLDLYSDDEAAADAWLRTGVRHRFTYNDGVVTLTWNEIPILGVPDWGDLCGVWCCLSAVVDGYLSTGRGNGLFPDQPLHIGLESVQGGAIMTAGSTKTRVEPVTFCRELLHEAERFWHWTDRWGIPVNSGQALQEIERVRTKIPWR